MTNRHDQYDIHLLRILQALITSGSVSRTAEQLQLSQPAVSGALKRLRALIGDPLLVRTGRGMTPTDHALSLVQPTRRALAEIDRVFVNRADFSPSTEERFSISVPDYLDPGFVPQLVHEAQSAENQVRLDIQPLYTDAECVGKLDRSELDLVIAPWDDPPPHLHFTRLWEDRLVLLLRRGHPLLQQGAVSPEDFSRARHVAVLLRFRSHSSIVDAHLSRAGYTRDVWLSLSAFGLIPRVLEESDLVFVCVSRFATQSAEQYGLVACELPMKLPKVRLLSLWHPRKHLAPRHKWLRQRVVDACRRMTA